MKEKGHFFAGEGEESDRGKPLAALFAGEEDKSDRGKPLAALLRPSQLEEVVGQNHLLGEGCVLRDMMETGRLGSCVLWGPPGTGKTTLARLLARGSGMEFVTISAVTSGVSLVRKVFEEAEIRKRQGGETCLFVDEIHRFNKAQQDSFLPKVEEGLVTLIGATTENPSFEINAAMLSRMRVFVLKRLDDEALLTILERAEAYGGKKLPLTDSARDVLLTMADGDGRYLLNMVEDIRDHKGEELTEEGLLGKLQRRRPLYDKTTDYHYNLISALHKSLRGSATDASLYWLARMLEGGDDPLYIARRLLRFAYEDVGLADPQAAVQALTAWETWHRLGSPEGDIALAQAVIYLATAPKSNRSYRALGNAQKSARVSGSLMPPKSILNAPTALMKKEGYGKGYVYDHDTADGFSGSEYFPDGMEREKYYEPVERGFERDIKKRLLYWEKLKGSFEQKRDKKETKEEGK